MHTRLEEWSGRARFQMYDIHFTFQPPIFTYRYQYVSISRLPNSTHIPKFAAKSSFSADVYNKPKAGLQRRKKLNQEMRVFPLSC